MTAHQHRFTGDPDNPTWHCEVCPATTLNRRTSLARLAAAVDMYGAGSASYNRVAAKEQALEAARRDHPVTP